MTSSINQNSQRMQASSQFECQKALLASSQQLILLASSWQLIITTDLSDSINKQTLKNLYQQKNSARGEYRENEQNRFENRDQNELRNNQTVVNYADFDQYLEQYQMISYTKEAENVNTTVYYANETNDQSHNENLVLKQSSKNSNAETNVYHAKTKSNAEKSETRRRKCRHCSKFFEFDNKLH